MELEWTKKQRRVLSRFTPRSKVNFLSVRGMTDGSVHPEMVLDRRRVVFVALRPAVECRGLRPTSNVPGSRPLVRGLVLSQRDQTHHRLRDARSKNVGIEKDFPNRLHSRHISLINKPMNTRTSFLVTFLAAGLSSAIAQEKPDFSKDIAPILRENCVKCHGSNQQKGKLRLDSNTAAAKGGKSGNPSWVAGKPDESEAIKRILLPKDNDDAMPPEGERLPAKKIDALKAWIATGAAWPDGVVIESPKDEAKPEVARSPTPAKPRPPMPVLPKDFKAGAAEAGAIAALAKAGVNVHPLAQNVPWTEANFRLQGTNVADKELALVKDLPSLVELRLGTTKITDSGLAALKNLPNLQVLSLELTSISDAGLLHLKSLNNLVYLNLYGTQVTDAGLDALGDKKHLRNLYLWQSKVTDAGVKKLQASLPMLEIDNGAQLVVAVSTNAPVEKKEEKKEEKK